MITFKSFLEESLRKRIAGLSGRYPEGSTVKRKKDGKKGKVLTVGKDFVKVAYGNRQVDHSPEEIVKEEAPTVNTTAVPGAGDDSSTVVVNKRKRRKVAPVTRRYIEINGKLKKINR